MWDYPGSRQERAQRVVAANVREVRWRILKMRARRRVHEMRHELLLVLLAALVSYWSFR